jgi:hypothetical protein
MVEIGTLSGIPAAHKRHLKKRVRGQSPTQQKSLGRNTYIHEGKQSENERVCCTSKKGMGQGQGAGGLRE